MSEKMKKITIFTLAILILLFTFALAIHGVKENNEWNKKYRGKGYAIAQDIEKTKDEGYIVCGMSVAPPDDVWDAWLLKIDKEGNKQWEKIFGGKEEDVFNCVIKTAGGYVMAGYTTLPSDERHFWLLKVNENGEKLWEKIYIKGKAEKVIETSDNGYIIVGTSYKDDISGRIAIIKTDKNGNVKWEKFFGGNKTEFGDDVIETSDDYYLISGITYSYTTHGGWDIWLIKIDKEGNEIWNKTYGWWNFEWNAYVIEIEDGYAVAGYTLSGPFGNEIPYAYLLVTDKQGNEIWKKRYGTPQGAEEIRDFEITNDGYILCGATDSYSIGDFDAWLLKVDKNGNEIWNRSFGGRGADWANAVVVIEDGYIFAGSTEKQFGNVYFQLSAWVVKCNDEIPPKIKIVRPKENYLYIFDREIMAYDRTLIIGRITVTAEADMPEKIDRAEFYYTSEIIYDWIPRKIDYSPPYEWKCKKAGMGLPGRITVAARYGNARAVAVDRIELYIINPFPAPASSASLHK